MKQANDNIPADEFDLAESIAWVLELVELFDSPPRIDNRDTEDVHAELQVEMEPRWSVEFRARHAARKVQP